LLGARLQSLSKGLGEFEKILKNPASELVCDEEALISVDAK
jgi:hypothetical protein